MADEIAWGKKVGPAFKAKVVAMSKTLGCDPSHLTSAMAFETGERFTANVQNPSTRATGLIQFMPATAKALGTTIEALAAMTAVDQLDWVAKYLGPYKNRMKTLSDVYMTILWPAAVGKPEAYALFKKPSKAYDQNAGLDANKDGVITKAEAAAKVNAKLVKGMTVGLKG